MKSISLMLAVAIGAIAAAIWLLRPDPDAAPAAGRAAHEPEDTTAAPDAAPDLRRSAAEVGFGGPEPAAVAAFHLRGRILLDAADAAAGPARFLATIDAREEGIVVRCDTAGEFVVPLPTAGTVVRLLFADHLRIVRATNCLRKADDRARVDGAREDVLIELEALPHTVLQLLLEPDLQPLAGAYGSFLIEDAGGSGMIRGFRADEAGRVPLPHSAIEQAAAMTIAVMDFPAGSHYQQALEPAPLRADPGPHVVRVMVGAPQRFFAHGADGRPVAGARAHFTQPYGAASGADGFGSYPDAVPHAAQVTFRAPDHAEARIPVPEPPPPLLDVPLQRASTLRIQLLDAPTETLALHGVRVRFGVAGAASALDRWEHQFGQVAPGRVRVGRSVRGWYSAVDLEMDFDPGGVAEITGLRTDLAADVEVRCAGVLLHQERVEFALDGVQREVRANGAIARRAVRGRVADEDGAGLVGIQVCAGPRDDRRIYAISDADGRFGFVGLPAQAEIEVWCDPEDRSPARALAPAGIADAEVALVAAQPRRVEVVLRRLDGEPYLDEDGGRARAWVTAIHSDGWETAAVPGTDPATWVLERLAPALVTLRVESFSGATDILHDTRVPEAVLVLRP